MKHLLRPMVPIYFLFPSSYFFFVHFSQLGGGNEIYSGLTFVGVNCEDAVFLNGIAPQQIWFQV